MQENLRDITGLLLKWLSIVVIFVTPLLFTPWTFDLFEFPKQALIWVTAALLLALWLLRFVADNEVKVIKTPVDLPLLLFIVVAAVSTLLSSARYTSLVGYFGRADGGLAGMLAYLVIFYVIASSLKNLKDVVHLLIAFLGSAAILALLSILYYFKLYIFPIDGVTGSLAAFSPAGGMYALTVLLALALPVALGMLLYVRQQELLVSTPQPMMYEGMQPTQTKKTTVPIAPFYSVFLAIASVFFLAVIILLGNTAAFAGVITALLVFFLWSKRGHVKRAAPFIMAIVAAAIFWVLLTTIPQIRQAVPALHQKIDKPTMLSADESWKVSIRTLTDLPFFGSGPATYLFDFTRYRPAANIGDNWNLRFVVAHDQYLQVLATLGIIGFALYILFLARLVMFSFKGVLASTRDTSTYPLKVGLVAAIAAFVVATLFISTTTTIMISFFVLIAIFMAIERLGGSTKVAERKLSFVLTSQNTNETKPVNAIPIALFIPGLVIAIAVIFFTAQYVRANVTYLRGVKVLQSNQSDAALKALQWQEQATVINPFEDAYHRDLARTSFNVAVVVSQKKDLTDNDKTTVQNLLKLAVSHAQVATQLAPLNVNNWQTLADIYRRIATQVQGAGDAALRAFGAAIQTDPTNPQQYLDIGGIFFAANAYDQAITAFQRAADLKPDFANAHYNLAKAYVQKGEYKNAYDEFQAVTQILNRLSDDDTKKKESLDLVQKEIDAIKDKIPASQSAQPQQAQPSSTPAPTATPTSSGKPQTSPNGSPLLKNFTPTPVASAQASASPASR